MLIFGYIFVVNCKITSRYYYALIEIDLAWHLEINQVNCSAFLTVCRFSLTTSSSRMLSFPVPLQIICLSTCIIASWFNASMRLHSGMPSLVNLQTTSLSICILTSWLNASMRLHSGVPSLVNLQCTGCSTCIIGSWFKCIDEAWLRNAVARCLFKLPASALAYSHPGSMHLWGFAPVCRRWWTFKSPAVVVVYSHPGSMHRWGFSPECRRWCLFNALLVVLAYSHPDSIHLWGFSPVCLIYPK